MPLIFAATPLGNFLDASENLKNAVTQAEIILAEDSRRFSRLAKDLNVSYVGKVISFFEGNEIKRIEQILSLLKADKMVLALTDAGMPGISDPGFRLAQIAIENKIKFSVIPGPSAVTTALLHSGLPCDKFVFEGFIGKTSTARKKYFESIKNESRTLIYFESPKRITNFLQDAAINLGPERNACICREMTKEYEEIVRGTLLELLEWSKSKEMLGEFTVVVAGNLLQSKLSKKEVLILHANLVKKGLSKKEVNEQVINESGWSKREIFDLLVSEKTNQGKR